VGIAVAVVLVVDQLSKRWALERLYPYEVVELIGSLQFRLRFNTGMAFSGFSNSGAIIGVVAIVIAVVLVVIARKVTSVFQLVLIGIMIGGALGNVIDRASRVGEVKDNEGTVAEGFMSGAVVDFIDLQWWPIFNVADAAIVVGGIALALTGLRTSGAEDESATTDDSATDVSATDVSATDDAVADREHDTSGTEVG
jgi:signal peptidase II